MAGLYTCPWQSPEVTIWVIGELCINDRRASQDIDHSFCTFLVMTPFCLACSPIEASSNPTVALYDISIWRLAIALVSLPLLIFLIIVVSQDECKGDVILLSNGLYSGIDLITINVANSEGRRSLFHLVPFLVRLGGHVILWYLNISCPSASAPSPSLFPCTSSSPLSSVISFFFFHGFSCRSIVI